MKYYIIYVTPSPTLLECGSPHLTPALASSPLLHWRTFSLQVGHRTVGCWGRPARPEACLHTTLHTGH